MEKLIQQATNKTPNVLFEPSSGQLILQGRSIPENSFDLFAPILDWLDRYTHEPSAETNFIFKLSLFNSASTEYILEILKKLSTLRANGNQVCVQWYYSEDDEDMEQVGEDFKMMLDLPIEMVATSEAEMDKY